MCVCIINFNRRQKMKKALMVVALFLVLTPMVAHGQLNNILQLVNSFRGIINVLIPLVGAIALLYFFWGLAKFILAAGDEEERAKGKQIMIWGIVALFVIVSVWGLVGWLGTALGVGTAGPSTIPNISN